MRPRLRYTASRRAQLWNLFLSPADRERLYLAALKGRVSQSEFMRLTLRRAADDVLRDDVTAQAVLAQVAE